MDVVVMNDFSFRELRKFRFFPAFQNNANYLNNLVTVSNEYGLLFVAQNNALRCMETKYLHENSTPTKQNLKQEVVDFPSKFVQFENDIQILKCNCDGSTLAIISKTLNGPFAYVYDVSALATSESTPRPYASFRLSASADPNVLITCFEWNPAIPDMFSFCCSDGFACIVTLSDKKNVSIQGSLQAGTKPKATCMSWSPKGKQLVCGFDDCTLIQFKPDFQPAKKIAAPTEAILEFAPFSVFDICWLSTTQFAAVYKSQDQSDVSVCHVTLNKDGSPTYANFGDVCISSPNGTDISLRYYFTFINDWSVLLCSATNSLETTVVGCDPSSKTWLPWDIEFKSELPLLKDGRPTLPLGVALDFTSQKPVVIPQVGADPKMAPPAPILFLYSNDGIICPYSLVYLRNDVPNLCKPPSKYANLKISQTTPAAAPAPTLAEAAPVQQPQTTQPLASVVPPVGFPPKNEQILKETTNVRPPSINPPSVGGDRKRTTSSSQQVDNKTEKLHREIRSNINNVDKELHELRRLLGSVKSLGDKQNLIDFTRRLDLGRTVVEETDKELTTVESALTQLINDVAKAKLSADETMLLMKNLNSREANYFLKMRPLSNEQETALKNLHKNMEHLEENVEETTQKFKTLSLGSDNNLSSTGQILKFSNDSSPSGSLIYLTLANMQAVIVKQKQKLSVLHSFITNGLALKLSSIELRERNVSSSSEKSFIKSDWNDFEKTSDLSTTAIRQDQIRLKRFLDSRKVVPRRTTIPKLNKPTFAFDVGIFVETKSEDSVEQLENTKPNISIKSTEKPLPIVQSTKAPVTIAKTSIPTDKPKVDFSAPPLSSSTFTPLTRPSPSSEQFNNEKFNKPVLEQKNLPKLQQTTKETVAKQQQQPDVKQQFVAEKSPLASFVFSSKSTPSVATTTIVSVPQTATTGIRITTATTTPTDVSKAKVDSSLGFSSFVPVSRPTPVFSTTDQQKTENKPDPTKSLTFGVEGLLSDKKNIVGQLQPPTLATSETGAKPPDVKQEPEKISQLISFGTVTAVPTVTVAIGTCAPMTTAVVNTVGTTATATTDVLKPKLDATPAFTSAFTPVSRPSPVNVTPTTSPLINEKINQLPSGLEMDEDVDDVQPPVIQQQTRNPQNFVFKTASVPPPPAVQNIAESFGSFGNFGGGKPKDAKPVFGSPFTVTSSSPPAAAATNSLFAPTTVSAFGGAAAQGTSPQIATSTVSPFQTAAAGFGGGGAFGSFGGGSPGMSSGSTFGSKPTFGGGSSFTSPFSSAGAPSPSSNTSPGKIFGSGFGTLAASSPNAGAAPSAFASFAQSSAPTFGSLASGAGAAPSFGSLSGGGGTGAAPSFGLLSGSGVGAAPTFGSLAGGATAPAPSFGSFGAGFGGTVLQQQQQQQPMQQPLFQQSTPAPSFSQWRG